MRLASRVALRVSLCGALSAALAISSLAQARVWTVDSNFPADFTDLQPAIDAAQDGDAILVQFGTYTPAVVSKRLAFLSEAWLLPPTVVTPTIGDNPLLTIENTTADQPVLILGVDFTADNTVSGTNVTGYPVLAESAEGAVWVQDAKLSGRGGIVVDEATAVVRDVTITGTVETGSPQLFGPHEGDAVKLIGAELLAYGGEWEGAAGGSSGCVLGDCGLAGTPGGEGLRVERESTAYVVGLEAKGGDGLNSPCNAGAGGDGVHVQPGCEVLAIESTFYPGAGGTSTTSCSDGRDGSEQIGGGTVTHTTGVRRFLSVDPLVREGDTVDVEIHGVAGEFVFIGIATEPVKIVDPQIEGPLVLGNLLSVISLALPAGELAFDFTADELPPGIEFFTFYAQPVFVAPTGERRAGDPTAFVILDSDA